MTDLDKVYIKGVVFVVFSCLLFSAGWVVKGWSDNSTSRSIEQAITKTQDISNKAAATAIAGITVTNTTVQGKVIERVRTETIYAECRHSPETYQLIKDAFK